MPPVVSHLLSVVASTYMADYNVGEMCFNFIVEPKIHPYAGVNFTCLFLEDVSSPQTLISAASMIMITGKYALSRRDTTKCIFPENNFLSYSPFHLTVDQRS